ncbi:MAG: hypothetical protein Q7J54_01435 [Candidatus Woesearchaeota archaeon]|nr:hypothetical protein [Candidatus Woesearchaeota archaeon]
MGTQLVTPPTMYVWEKRTPLDLKYIQSVLGMTKAPTLDELQRSGFNPRLGTHTIYTDEFIIYATNKDAECTEWATPIIKERLQKLELPLPNHELRFLLRCPNNEYVKINPEKIMDLAALVEMTTRSDVLLVPGTDIEGKVSPPLYVSVDIVQKVCAVALAKLYQDKIFCSVP